MTRKRELAVIIPTYGHFDIAQRCIQSLTKHTDHRLVHVIVIDDGSTDWSRWYQQPGTLQHSIIHYKHNGGLTRSWNEGLRQAKLRDLKYALCTNSDVIFSEGWYDPMKKALTKYSLVGPVTNAPGHATWQSINHVCQYEPSDDQSAIDRCAGDLRILNHQAVHAPFINGFFMLAKTATWWAGAFDKENVFNPAMRLTGNEDELQARWRKLGWRIGYVCKSFIFHYRSISRPEALKYDASKGAFRKETEVQLDRHLHTLP